MTPTKVKICGITSVGDARLAVSEGADFLGLNFFYQSPRCITVDGGREIREAVGSQVPLVGVFVNEAPSRVGRIAEAVGLDYLQFHGDEPPAAVAPFASRAIRALRVGPDFCADDLTPWLDCWALLIDAWDPKAYGGTGRRWDPERLPPEALQRRLFVAGGLSPDNVGEMITELSPWGVDVCSGVESEPGRKDPELLRRFFEEVRDVQVTIGS